MGEEAANEWAAETLPPDVEARMHRHISVLLGLVPLADMTQNEVDWVFRSAVQWAD